METSKQDRRNSDERRAGSERRRGSDDRFVVLEVDRTQLRLAVVVRASGDKPLLVTRAVTWRQESNSLLTHNGAAELSAAIKALAAEERLGGSETMLLLAAPQCVTRTATATSATIDKQVKELEERGHLYLTLGGGTFSMASRRYQLDARHEHAVLTIANETIVDAAAEACHDAGLQLKRIESSTVALSRAHGVLHQDDESPVLLVSLNEKSVVLAVTQQGRVLLEYLPSGEVKPANLPTIVNQHLQRMQRFCARKHLGQADSISKVYLTGDPDQAAAAKRAFAGQTQLAVTLLDVTKAEELWETRGQSVKQTSAATLGGAALKSSDERSIEGPNLLEKWIRESRKHQRPILLRSVAPAAAVLLITIGLAGLNFSLGMGNSRLAKQVAAGKPVQARYNNLRLDLLSAEGKLKSLHRMSEGLPRPDLHTMVERLGRCLPDDVWLERLTVADGKESSLQGAGFTETGVYEFVGNLEGAPGASDVALQETGVQQRKEGPVTRFSLTAKLDAAGNRANDPEEPNE